MKIKSPQKTEIIQACEMEDPLQDKIKSYKNHKVRLPIRLFVFSFFWFLILCSSCENPNMRLNLNQQDTLNFTGVFKFVNSATFIGTILLQTSYDYFHCSTSLPYDWGAGRLLVKESTLDFIDTAVYFMPCMYARAYTLSGEYNYQFDGKDLLIWKNKGNRVILYELKLEKNN